MIESDPEVWLVHSSVITACVVSPAIFLAIAGRPLVFCTWSLINVNPSSVGVSRTSTETTSCASATCSRKAGSDSIANTSSGLAS